MICKLKKDFLDKINQYDIIMISTRKIKFLIA